MGLRTLFTGSRSSGNAIRARGPWRNRAPHLLAATGFIVLFAGIGTVAIRLSLGAPADEIPTSALPADQTDSIVVQYKDGADQADLQERYDENDAVQTKSISKLRTHVVKIPKAKRQQVLQDLAKDPNVKAAEPIQYGHAEATTPNDPEYAKQAFWVKIGVNQLWDTTKGDAKVILADIDTGVNADHPDLKAKLMAGYDFVENDQTPQDGAGHGTAVAGVLGASTNNALGVAGGCWNCKVMPLRVLDNNGSGTDATVAQAIQYAVDHGAQILNLSLSFAADTTVLKTAIDYAASHNVMVIAAAGNQAGTAPRYPAAYPSVLSIAGTEADDTLTSESNYGDTVDMAAPGAGIYTTMGTNTYAAWTGTSFASPIVAAVAGLLKSAYPAATVADLRAAITTTTDPCCNNRFPAGRINAVKANTYLANKFPSDKTGPTLTIGVPAANATVKGTVSITANAQDTSGVAKVEFKIDGGTPVADTTEPYSYAWNTTTASNAAHTITVTAYDTLGNQTQATRTVTVNNVTETTKVPGDVNGDRKVNINDLSIVLYNWSKTTSTGDLNGDGKVNINDLSIVLYNWGRQQ